MVTHGSEKFSELQPGSVTTKWEKQRTTGFISIGLMDWTVVGETMAVFALQFVLFYIALSFLPVTQILGITTHCRDSAKVKTLHFCLAILHIV